MEDERSPLLPSAGSSSASRSSRAVPLGPLARARRTASGRLNSTNFACGAVLLTEVLERIAFYGAIGNLVVFLNENPLHWASYNAMSAFLFFTGFSCITALLGGWIADTLLGRFKTILLFFVFYIGGYVILPLLDMDPKPGSLMAKPPSWCARRDRNSSSAMTNLGNATEIQSSTLSGEELVAVVSPGVEEHCTWAVYLSLGLMGLGIGAVKANIAPFGADQVKGQGPFVTRVFFNWFYWCVNIGALISLGAVAYVQQEYNFFWGYVIPNICLVLAVVVFLCGRCFYITNPPGGSVITNILKIIIESCRLGHRSSRRNSRVLHSNESLDAASRPRCLDFAKVCYGGSFHDSMVDDVKTLGKIICVFLSLVPYWVVYFQIPVAWLSLFDVVFLVVLIPLLDRVIYPRLDKHGIMLTLRTRILIGMVFAMLAVTVAGGVEMHRLNVLWGNGTEKTFHQKIGNTTYNAADVSILLQIPQYALIGISEVFTSVAGLELAYTEAPRSMQGIIMALFWISQGLGSFLGTGIMSAFRGTWFFSWDYGDINCRVRCQDDPAKICHACHLDYYFFVLAGVQVFGIFLFLAIAAKSGIGGVAASRKRYPGIGSGSERNSGNPSTSASESQSEAEDQTARGHIQQRRMPSVSSTDSDATR